MELDPNEPGPVGPEGSKIGDLIKGWRCEARPASDGGWPNDGLSEPREHFQRRRKQRKELKQLLI